MMPHGHPRLWLTAVAGMEVEFAEFSGMMQLKSHVGTCVDMSITGTARACVGKLHQDLCTGTSIPADTLQKPIPNEPVCLAKLARN
jgi:hypothetical protein